MTEAATRVILTDIEGTTTSLAFVSETLFPFARARIGAFVRDRENAPEVAASLAETRRLMGAPEAPLEEVIERLERWIDEDRKATPLKALQGLLWEHGYRAGELVGHIYDDAVDRLVAWHGRGLRLYVYSSGSVLAQRLLFSHSRAGDLTPLLAGHFDTETGPKAEPASYRRIVAALAHDPALVPPVEPAEVLFLSDAPPELEAARAAGLKTVQLLREAWMQPVAGHAHARNFGEITP